MEFRKDEDGDQNRECFLESIRYRVFTTGGRVASLYFTSEVTGSLKSDFSAANLHLHQYSLSNHLREKGLVHSGELLQRESEKEVGGARKKKQSIQQYRSECGCGKLPVNTE